METSNELFLSFNYKMELLSIARGLLTINLHKESKIVLQRLLKHFPGCTEALALLGQVELSFGEEKQGISDIQRSITLDDGNVESGVIAARTLSKAGNVTEALEILSQVIAANPQEIRLQTVRTEILLENGILGSVSPHASS